MLENQDKATVGYDEELEQAWCRFEDRLGRSFWRLLTTASAPTAPAVGALAVEVPQIQLIAHVPQFLDMIVGVDADSVENDMGCDSLPLVASRQECIWRVRSSFWYVESVLGSAWLPLVAVASVVLASAVFFLVYPLTSGAVAGNTV